MADLKYGQMYTESDLEKILQLAWDHGDLTPAQIMKKIVNDDHDLRLKFSRDEPTITFRARDKRAEGAIRHYEDHQSPNVPAGHMENIERTRRAFEQYRLDHPGEMKEPD